MKLADISGTKGRNTWKIKIEENETNSKIKNIKDLYRGIIDFTKGYQPRTNVVKDEKGDLVAYSYSILARWRKSFSPRYWMYMGLMMLSGQKYTQQNH